MAVELPLRTFDTAALYRALDGKRDELGLTWAAVARQFWDLDADLNRQRPSDHPFSGSTITSMARRGSTSCQHALFMCRWLNVSPEHFLRPAIDEPDHVELPDVPGGRRLRWSLKRLHAAAARIRIALDLTWPEAAAAIGYRPSQLTGLRTAKFATNIDLAMKIVQWSGRPSTDFLYLASW